MVPLPSCDPAIGCPIHVSWFSLVGFVMWPSLFSNYSPPVCPCLMSSIVLVPLLVSSCFCLCQVCSCHAMPCQLNSTQLKSTQLYFKTSLCLLFGHFLELNKAAFGFSLHSPPVESLHVFGIWLRNPAYNQSLPSTVCSWLLYVSDNLFLSK